MPSPVAVVTDSTASLPRAAVARYDIAVVPLQVVIGLTSYDEGTGVTAQTLSAALSEQKPVSTSRPTPEVFLRAYEAAAAAGAESVVSIHLSAEVSGTYDSARLAAGEAPTPVEVVDSRQVGMGTGFAVLAAARAVRAGASAVEAASAARRCAHATTVLFYVDTLEHLRRGGRIGAAAALVGSVLAVKPLLKVDNGRIIPLEKVRTSARALSRMEDLAVEAVHGRRVDVAVHHVANPGPAQTLADRLRGRMATMADLVVSEVGAVIGAHVGPGTLAVVVAPAPPLG
jgi:fatty acid kinase fatty acid binding subunit